MTLRRTGPPVFILLAALSLRAQTNTGELRLAITDSSGLPVQAQAQLGNKANDFNRTYHADSNGHIVARRLPYGRYLLSVSQPGLASAAREVDIESPVPQSLAVSLSPEKIQSSITVSGNEALIDPENTSGDNRIGQTSIADRLTGRPGRDLAEMVNQEPGWLFEANGVLHPRGEEYQAQYVVDGIPLTENRSSAFVPDFNAEDVQEMTVMTAGFPAEYGRKMGGVIEVETQRDTRPGFHGKVVATGGSFDTVGGFADAQYGWKTSTLTLSASSSTTDRYLDPPSLENYTNHGTIEDYALHYEQDVTQNDHLGIVLRRDQARFLVPNEIVEQLAGQRQDRNSFETAAQISWQHVFSPQVVGDFRAMSRDLTAGFWSNDLSTPMIASQDRGYHEQYVKATISFDTGIHEFKFGGESDYARIDEGLYYLITDPTQFDPDTPQSFNFYQHAPDREQSGFAQDRIRWKNLTVDAGLRFDHYDLLVNQTAWSPRIGASVYWPLTKIVFRADYDRIFQTPAFENLLVSSSPDVISLSDQVLRLPVQPARGDYYQAGLSRGFFGNLQFKTNFYWRSYSNYPDDDLLLNTGVSFPIAFSRADIYGVEAKLDVPHWGPFSGYASWSNMRGNGYFPVTGGLFLGDDAVQALSTISGVFPVSQDQRNTARVRVRYDASKRLWFAAGANYDSGLPFDFTGTYEDAAQQYSAAILNRVNFSNGRTRPQFSLDASAGVTLTRSEKRPVRLQVDAINLTNKINVLDFAGLFSGTAIGPPRSVQARLRYDF